MVNKAGRPVWSGPPAAPDRAIITRDVSCQGILGMTLQNALQSLHANSTTDSISKGNDNDNDNDAITTDNTKNSISKSSIFEDQQSIDRIMKSFAEAIAQSYETMSSSTIPITTNIQSDGKKRSIPVAPSAVLCGNVDHYNRRSDKWRFLIRNSKIVERKQYDASHFNTRARQKPLFWNVATATAVAAGDSVGDTATTTAAKSATMDDSNHILMSEYSNDVLSLNGDLEVLVYNDR